MKKPDPRAPVSANAQPNLPPEPHARRPRYSGRNPRKFHDKYKELNPDRHSAVVRKVLDSGRTPAGMHRPVLVEEILQHLAPHPGDVAIDATLGGGGHAQALLDRIQPDGRLIGLDVDPIELPRTEARLRAAGFGPEVFVAHQSNFAGLPKVLETHGLTAADLILADLGVSSMQLDNPDRGFTFKESGPLDMRMNPARGRQASALIAHLDESRLVRLLEENADEPRAALIAALLKAQPITTTGELRQRLTAGMLAARPRAGTADIDASIRRTCQALRIAVNDEFSSLEAFLRVLPSCLAPAGRVVVLTFHSGEDRRVKQAFESGLRDGAYAAISDSVTRASAAEIRSNPRASAAKLRWAIRAGQPREL